MEQSRVLVDSSVFIAYYRESDTCHKQALLLLEILGETQVILPYCIIQEVCTVLTYKEGKDLANFFLEDIQKAENILVVNNDVFVEIEYFKTRKGKLSFTDFSLLQISQFWKAELITFDEQLLKLYKKSKSV